MKLPVFPEPLRAVFSLLPHYPASAVFAALLTLQVGEQIGASVMPELLGKKIRLCIKDAGVTLLFEAGPDGFFACSGSDADLTVTATAQDFLALALRREDPDTLFFSRRLLMEGDTELGLLLKNTLDGMVDQTLKPRLHAFPSIIHALRLQVFRNPARPFPGAAHHDNNLI